MSVTLDGIAIALADFLGTSHTENETATTGTSGESYPEEPMFPDRVFRAMLNQIAQGWTPTVVSVTGTTKTIALSDLQTIQACDNASAQTLTIENESNSPAPGYTADGILFFEQLGAGQVTITGEAGVSINGTSGGSVAIDAQYRSAYARRLSSNSWIVAGGVV